MRYTGYMKINLKDLSIAYINLDSYPNRNQSMINMLDACGLSYTRVAGIKGKAYDAIAQAHLNALDTGADLILEDDCLPFDYREEIELPNDADVVYLGVSTGTTGTHKSKYNKLSNDIYRLYDMASLHAVLYITEAGRQWLRNAVILANKERMGIDQATARLMPTIKVYGLNSPIWYQRDVPEQTKKTLDIAMLSDEYAGGGFEDYDEPYIF